jgi:hypothetical protein
MVLRNLPIFSYMNVNRKPKIQGADQTVPHGYVNVKDGQVAAKQRYVNVTKGNTNTESDEVHL